ncbi:MAG TPA: Fe-S protein assembly co-chaperone HscB [Acidobacteriaceae bacterium]|jgi:molecular chaperone HscB
MQSHAQNSIKPDIEQTYFEMFSLPRKLTIDTAVLEGDFYKLSRRLHPDLYARKSAEEQAWSLRQSSLLNDAYRTLKDPVSRTAYLLKLEGMRIEDENAETRDPQAKQNRVPADLLEEVFELNMQLEEMRANLKMGEDDPALRGDLERAQMQFKDMQAAVDEDLQRVWAAWDMALDANDDAAKNKQKDAMVALLDRRSYLRNLLREVDGVLSQQTAGAVKANT